MLAKLRWAIRGVGALAYRRLCARCGRTGQAHWGFGSCFRFKERS